MASNQDELSPKKFTAITAVFQIAMIVIFGVYFEYPEKSGEEIQKFFGSYQDVHAMLLLGFGFLMTFLKKYSFSAVGYNYLLTMMGIQWGLICNQFFHMALKGKFEHATIGITSLISADFAAAAVLITFGALLGKTSPLQMVVILFFEIIFFAVNESLGVVVYSAVDMGGSMFVHTFGAYFGLAASMVISTKEHSIAAKKFLKSNRHSDGFAMVGTLILSFGWASFNGALAADVGGQHRVIINTIIALAGSTVSTFIASQLLREGYKFSMVDVQNATLAGGVAVGSSADLVIEPWGAFLVGSVAGLLSVVGYVYVQPFLERVIGLQDTCGVHNLHGMPGIMGGIGGAISAASVSNKITNVNKIYPKVRTGGSDDGRTLQSQAGFQIAALISTLGISIAGGFIAGFIAKQKFFLPPKMPFQDCEYWEVPSDDEDEEMGVKSNNPPLKKRSLEKPVKQHEMAQQQDSSKLNVDRVPERRSINEPMVEDTV